jgi:hypothetical protein
MRDRYAGALIVVALLLVAWLSLAPQVAAQLGIVTIQAVDALTGGTVSQVGDARRKAIRVVNAADDPIVQSIQQLTAAFGKIGPTGKLFGLITSTKGALDVNIKYPPALSDPCGGEKTNVAVSQTTSSVIIAGQTGRIRICKVFLIGADAEKISLVEGIGSACGTNKRAISGSATAASGPAFAANGGYVDGVGGWTIAQQAIIGNDVCAQQDGSGVVAGNVLYVVSPF